MSLMLGTVHTALHKAHTSFTSSSPVVPRPWCAWTMHLLKQGGGNPTTNSFIRQHPQTRFMSLDITRPASLPSLHRAEISFKENTCILPGHSPMGLGGASLPGVPWP